MANRLPRDKRAQILHALVEGVGMRSISRIFDVHTKSVDRVLHEAGDLAISYIDALGNLPVRAIQADELWGFVQTKKFELSAMQLDTLGDGKKGRVWVFLAVCADTRFILTYHIGSHMKADVIAFMEKVARKLPRDGDGCVKQEVTITTDALRSYHDVVEQIFGSSVNYGMVTKQYGRKSKQGDVIRLSPENEKRPGDRYVSEKREAKIGTPAERDLHTCYVERHNANARMQNRRLTRKTYGFSRKFLNLERQLALWILYRNYCWIPDNKRKAIDRGTAAMALGIEESLWSVGDILDLSDAFREEKAELTRAETESDAAAAPDVREFKSEAGLDTVHATDLLQLPTHWVYHHKRHYSAKVHASECTNCRDGQGKTNSASPVGEWYPFFDLDDARRFAQQLEPYNHSDCRVCIVKEYQKREHRF
tara:strand:+ start:31071 stop:32339 length:1269 start_codon:yes stop_codon:yes gene_type:complete